MGSAFKTMDPRMDGDRPDQWQSDRVASAEGPPPHRDLPRDLGDDGGGEGGPAFRPPISNARLGMMFFLGAEAMLFAGLISAFLVFRFGAGSWPPPGQPRLPIAVTLVNTAVLLFSAFTMRRAVRTIRVGDLQRFLQSMLITALLGITFLAVQGSEWAGLIRFGLTLSAGIYGSTFYTLIGMHAVHVLVAVVWLLLVLWRGKARAFSVQRYRAVELCSMYWHFVVAVWPVLFVLVYPNWSVG